MKPYRVLITGSRDWSDITTLFDALDEAYLEAGDFRTVRVVHGAARGADSLAQVWYESRKERGWYVEIERHPAKWTQYGKRAGILRNEEMVKLGADLCLAFPLPESKGTKHCMDIARKAGIPLRWFEPRVPFTPDAGTSRDLDYDYQGL